MKVRVQTKQEGRVGPVEVLLIERTVEEKPQTSYHLSNAGSEVKREELVRGRSERHRVEEVFEEGNGEVGLDHYEVRSWVGWLHHMTLSLLALGRRRPRQRPGGPLRDHQNRPRPGAPTHRRRGRPAHRAAHRPAPRQLPDTRLPAVARLPLEAHPGRARAPKKSLAEHVAIQREFLTTELQPILDAALAAAGHVYFVDAAHFVYGTFLCCLWSIGRLFVRAASGRQRFNVLGAWNAVTRELLAVTNTTVVNTETMCELLRKIAAQGLAGPVTLVLDNARYLRNKAVQALAAELGIRLLFLPSYSPNLNLIERLWGFAKRQSVYGKCHADFASFRAAIEAALAGVSTTHAPKLKSLMTLTFQEFDDVSLLAA